MEDLSKYLVEKNMTIKEVVKQMDKGAKKIVFVTNSQRHLLGAVTDGDVRRWILSEGSLGDTIEKIYNKKPVYVLKKDAEKMTEKQVHDLVIETELLAVPEVDDDMVITDLYFLADIIHEDIKERKKQASLDVPVVIMAGGQGSRLDPFTRILPKALIPIGDKPVAEVIVENFIQYTTANIYFVLGYKAEMIKSYFDNNTNNYNVTYINEGKDPRGTAGGLSLLPKDLPPTFFLSNCDTIIDARYDEIYEFHKKKNCDITIIGSMQHFVLPYGILTINSGGELKDIEEKPEYDYLVNTGMYVMENRVLECIPEGEIFHITDLIKEAKRQGMNIGVFPVSAKSWQDAGQWDSFRQTAKNMVGFVSEKTK